MSKFQFTKIIDVERDLIFQISTDYENFTKILPNYFKELKIVKQNGDTTVMQERLEFLGRDINVLTEHVIEKPDRHIVKMLDGKAKGTIFDERYEIDGKKTIVNISVDLVLHGGLKILGTFAKGKIKENMNIVTVSYTHLRAHET